MNNIQIWYHANCNDGLAAAAVAYSMLRESATYIAVKSGEFPPPVADGDRVFIVDFSYKRDVLLQLGQVASWLVVLDHHKTAQEDLSSYEWPAHMYVHFDLSQSGAMLAWKYWRPDDPASLFVELIQDWDLWTFKLNSTRELNAGLELVERTPQRWALFLSGGLNEIVSDGSIILRYKQMIVERAVSHRFMVPISGHMVPCVPATLCISEIGEALCLAEPSCLFSATYRDSMDNNGRLVRVYSLRSGKLGTNSESFDCSVVAKLYGGGGHPHACGFSVPLPIITP